VTDKATEARRWFAEDIGFKARVSSRALVDAFAKVSREQFVGPGPWQICGMDGIWTTADDNPANVYHDVLIVLDEEHHINNDEPILYAFLFDQLRIAPGESVIHLGCGMGYYTAILAEIVGSGGRIEAFEIRSNLADRARTALVPWSWVTVRHDDGAGISLDEADITIVSAGATHPLNSWLDALTPGGRLLFPMTSTDGTGKMLLITRRREDGFAARFLCWAGFMELSGARDGRISERLTNIFREANDEAAVKSLRRDMHEECESCWLHENDWCLSRCDPAAVS